MKRFLILTFALMVLGCSGPSASPRMSVGEKETPITRVSAGLTVEEYFLTTDKELGRMDAEYYKRLPALRAQREDWREPSPQMAVIINRQLNGTGYVVEYSKRNNTRVLDLYKDNQVIASDLGLIKVARSASGQRFLLDVGAIAVADENGPVPQERFGAETPLYWAPIYVGEDVISIQWDSPTQSIQVLRNGKVDYSSPFGRTLASYQYAAQGLNSWDGKWVLETWDDQVIVDGTSLNQELGYEMIFAFRMLAGKPFFFFTENGKVRVSYGGEVLPIEYEAVAHHGCCDTTWVNPVSSDVMISFFGSRGGSWYYVDIGRYE